MSIGNLLYQLILGPLELVFDVIYSLAYHITEHPGTAIVFLSLAMNFLVLPLYRRADAMQEEERLQSMRMKPGIDQIKKMFKGDERFMILQTYYRQNNYKPYYALKGSLSLLLEIPFFIAAYRYLSGLSLLQDASFGPIRDLGSPDGLIRLGGMSLNLLPILMTGINLISGAVCLTAEGGITFEMERYFRNMPGAPDHLKAIRVLEFNGNHRAYKAMKEAFDAGDKERAAKIVKVLHAQALLIAEAAFKSAARTFREAVEIDPDFADEIPSTKGVL